MFAESSTMALCFKLSSDVLLHGKFLIINSNNTKKYKIPYLITGMSSCLSFVNLSMEVMAESKVWYVWTFLLTHFDKPIDKLTLHVHTNMYQVLKLYDFYHVLTFNFFQYKEKFWLLDNFYVTLNFILIPDKSVVHKNDGSPVFSTKSNVFFFYSFNSFIHPELFLFLSSKRRYFIHVGISRYTPISQLPLLFWKATKDRFYLKP